MRALARAVLAGAGLGLVGAVLVPTAGAMRMTGKVTVTGPMIPVPTNPTTAAAYMTVHNGTMKAVAVVGASVPSSVAQVARPMKEVLHGQTETMADVRRITVPAMGSFTLAPGNYHIMLTGLKADLSIGDKVPLTLDLSNGTTVAVTAPVVPLSKAFGTGAPMKGMH